MITVPEATKVIVERSRYLSEAIGKGLINHSSLARYIRPEIEQMLIKDVSVASIIMALKRFEKEFKPRYNTVNIFKEKPMIMLRSGLVYFSIENKFLIPKIQDLSDEFMLLSIGTSATSVVASKKAFELFIKTNLVVLGVTALTIKLPEEANTVSGVYYFFLKSLAWDGVNIIEIFSSGNELTIVLKDSDAAIAYQIITSLFT